MWTSLRTGFDLSCCKSRHYTVRRYSRRSACCKLGAETGVCPYESARYGYPNDASPSPSPSPPRRHTSALAHPPHRHHPPCSGPCVSPSGVMRVLRLHLAADHCRFAYDLYQYPFASATIELRWKFSDPSRLSASPSHSIQKAGYFRDDRPLVDRSAIAFPLLQLVLLHQMVDRRA